MRENLGSYYGIIKINTDTKEITYLYENIPDLKEADLLAQLAMCNKQGDELIYITPGWNKSIDKNHQNEYKEALRLAEDYKADEGVPLL